MICGDSSLCCVSTTAPHAFSEASHTQTVLPMQRSRGTATLARCEHVPVELRSACLWLVISEGSTHRSMSDTAVSCLISLTNAPKMLLQVGLLATRVSQAINSLKENCSVLPDAATRSVVLLGERGVGKTSLINLILRLGELPQNRANMGPSEEDIRQRAPEDEELEAVGVLNGELAAEGFEEVAPPTLLSDMDNAGAQKTKQRID